MKALAAPVALCDAPVRVLLPPRSHSVMLLLHAALLAFIGARARRVCFITLMLLAERA